MPHTELARNSGGGSMVRGVDSTLGGVALEGEWSCKVSYYTDIHLNYSLIY
jgi:hypothetical protein